MVKVFPPLRCLYSIDTLKEDFSMKPRILLLMVMTLMIVSMPSTVYARDRPNELSTDNTMISLMYEDVQYLSGSLDINSNGLASVSAQMMARTAESTKLNLYLKRYVNGSWETYKSWSVTEQSRVCSVLKDYYVPKGYQYKLYVYGYAWVNEKLVDTPSYISDSVYY